MLLKIDLTNNLTWYGDNHFMCLRLNYPEEQTAILNCHPVKESHEANLAANHQQQIVPNSNRRTQYLSRLLSFTFKVAGLKAVLLNNENKRACSQLTWNSRKRNVRMLANVSLLNRWSYDNINSLMIFCHKISDDDKSSSKQISLYYFEESMMPLLSNRWLHTHKYATDIRYDRSEL